MTEPHGFQNAARSAQYEEEAAPQPQPVPTLAPVETPTNTTPQPGRRAAEVTHTAPQLAPAAPQANDAQPEDLRALLAAGSVASGASGPRRATQGVRGFFAKVGIPMAPGAAEVAQIERQERNAANEATVRQARWKRAVGVLVANRKGSAGKTPSAVQLAGALATIRGGSVCAMEVADDPGTLFLRSEGSQADGLGELIRDVQDIRSAGQLAGYMAPQTSYAHVLGTPATRPPLTYEDVRAVSACIDDYYSMRVMDSGNQYSSGPFRAALDVADALVIPILSSADVVLEAVALLEGLRQGNAHDRALAESATVLRLVDGRPEDAALTDRLLGALKAAGHGVLIDVPFDPHIGARTEITLARCQPETREAFTAAAAAVVHSINHTMTVRGN